MTTNFDVLFERALARQVLPGHVAAISRAGQDLPAPGTAAFSGIIHLHGRLADDSLALSQSRLVLTSADYGEAYMRSGWAARFLFDLARTSTLVLLGYSAGDAPVRYFLNVLEADRARFSDLKPVYALDGFEAGGEAEVVDRWSPLAVPVLTYPIRRPEGADPDHGTLWRDLARLADIIENTAAERRRLAEEILVQPRAGADDAKLQMLRWALNDGAAIENAVIDSIVDPTWWSSLLDDGLLDRDRVARLAAAWAAQRWKDADVFHTFLRMGPKLGSVFAQMLDWHLRHTGLDTQPWQLAWRLLARQVSRAMQDQEDRVTFAVDRLQAGQGLDVDLRRLVGANTPSVRLSPPFYPSLGDEVLSDGEMRLGRLCYVDLETPSWANAPDLQLLTRDPRSVRIATITTNALLDALNDGQDAGVIGASWWDLSDHQVPAIGGHEQNQLVQGLLPLTSLLATLASCLATTDRPAARQLFARWRDGGHRLTTRLWLNGLLTQAYDADEAGRALLDLPTRLFWSLKRDIVRVLAEKLKGCLPEVREAIEHRILVEGPALYDDRPEPDEGADWRPDARDQEVWLRLTMLRRSGPLTPESQGRLEEIHARRSYLSDEPEERDLFSTWSTSRIGHVGDAQLIIEAEAPARVEVAVALMRSGDFEQQHAWSRYVETSPQGALDSLRVHPVEDRQAALWAELLSRIGFSHRIDPAQADAAKTWVEQALEHLVPASDAFIDQVLYPLATTVEAAIELGAPAQDAWWGRVWAAAERAPAPRDASVVTDVLNSVGGRLAMALLQTLKTTSGQENALSVLTRDRLVRVASSETEAGRLGRGALVRELTRIHHVAPEIVNERLHPRLIQASAEGRMLRATLLQWSSVDAPTSVMIRDVISLGVRESTAGSVAAINLVGKLLYPLLLDRLRPEAPDFGVHAADVAADLHSARVDTRVAVLEYLVIWMRQLKDRDRATEWREVVGPVLDSIWPHDRRLRSLRYTPPLLALMALAEDAFSQAARWALPWLQAFERDWFSLHDIEERLAILRCHPEMLFQVLWIVAGPPFEGHSTGLAAVLDAIVQERPALARDRRMQTLEARTFRPAA